MTVRIDDIKAGPLVGGDGKAAPSVDSGDLFAGGLVSLDSSSSIIAQAVVNGTIGVSLSTPEIIFKGIFTPEFDSTFE